MNLIDELIYHLNGTSLSLEEGCSDLGINSNDLSLEDLIEIDNWIFQCDGCGWWCDIGDRVSNSIGNFCSDCADE